LGTGHIAKTLAALAGDAPDDGGARLFLRTAAAVPSDPADLVLMNQRARRLWNNEYPDLVAGRINARPADVKIAYWLLSTSQQLVINQGLEIDQSTQWAMNWMTNLLADPSQRRLFGTQTVPAEAAEKLAKQLQQRDPYVYNSLVQQMSKDLQTSDQEIVRDVCNRIEALNSFFEPLASDELDKYNGQFANSLTTATNLAICKARALADARARGITPPAEDIQAATALVGTIRSAVRRRERTERLGCDAFTRQFACKRSRSANERFSFSKRLNNRSGGPRPTA